MSDNTPQPHLPIPVQIRRYLADKGHKKLTKQIEALLVTLYQRERK